MSEEKQDQIIKLLTKLTTKVDVIASKLESMEGNISESKPTAAEIGVSTVKPSDRAWEEKQEEKDVVAGGRLKCPGCNAVGNDIATEQDKDNIITYIGGVPQYGKKYYCKKCMKQWTQ